MQYHREVSNENKAPRRNTKEIIYLGHSRRHCTFIKPYIREEIADRQKEVVSDAIGKVISRNRRTVVCMSILLNQ